MKKLQLERYIGKSKLRDYTQLYIYFMGVKYTSNKLNNYPHLLGKKFTILVNDCDLRKIDAYYSDGEYFDTLTATGVWGIYLHDITQRKAILNWLEVHGRENDTYDIPFFRIYQEDEE